MMSHTMATPILSCLMFGILIFIVSFISNRKHLLATLLSLEGLMLMLFGMLLWVALSFTGCLSFLLVFLTLTACEGALGLGLLVLIIRTHGGDHFNSMNSLQC
uniref:NADH dehydrogenase subunit 4L n=1 Tax=Daphnia tibetana TaxID=2172416 RepID=UPI002114770D|nr:NADH dehydrogenase subunit 4L [Daphnia tibetana]USH58533.1 NADH dehydrogenase subunit 4L [Daphnia tibetana]